MSGSWQKLGLLYCPHSNQHPKLFSHTANPLPVLLENDCYRIYFSSRDQHNRSSVGAVDIDIVKREIIHEYNYPFFEHGREGSFYADGVSIGNCYKVGDIHYMLFMGWQTPSNAHWRGDIGRLVLNNDFSLRLDTDQPLLTADTIDPLSFSYPWVLADESGFRMWYGSTLTWDSGNAEMLHVINYATSDNGHDWTKHGLAVPYQLGIAQAFSRPSVIKDKNGFHMWFSYRSGTRQKYRIGYAISMTGATWQLKLEETGIDVSDNGWDADMICYPFVFDHKNKRYMLYNGNGYGQTGFGIAILQP